jgi:hypothetical protein
MRPSRAHRGTSRGDSLQPLPGRRAAARLVGDWPSPPPRAVIPRPDNSILYNSHEGIPGSKNLPPASSNQDAAAHASVAARTSAGPSWLRGVGSRIRRFNDTTAGHEQPRADFSVAPKTGETERYAWRSLAMTMWGRGAGGNGGWRNRGTGSRAGRRLRGGGRRDSSVSVNGFRWIRMRERPPKKDSPGAASSFAEAERQVIGTSCRPSASWTTTTFTPGVDGRGCLTSKGCGSPGSPGSR